MKFMIVFAGLVACVLAGYDEQAQIINYESEQNPDGAYRYSFQTSNGIGVNEAGTPKNFGGNPPNVPVVKQGSYQYPAPEGETISISWVADEYGFRASGNAIPTPPPVPEAILRSIQYNEQQRAAGVRYE